MNIQDETPRQELTQNAEAAAVEQHDKEHAKYFYVQNAFVAIAALLFLASMLPERIILDASSILKTVAYLMGALAYGTEIIALTARFTKKIPKYELFMPCVFGVLYILLGISYLSH